MLCSVFEYAVQISPLISLTQVEQLEPYSFF